ncbi:hypothetical protein D3C72_2347010 [compost metagenome]
MLAWIDQPRSSWNTRAMAYMLMPEASTVMAANEMALRPRVFSSKRSLRYSGTLRALEP